MHLINKPDTEYTGQETYVWNMYQQRCWDFFPVGDCFRKQYEDELGSQQKVSNVFYIYFVFCFRRKYCTREIFNKNHVCVLIYFFKFKEN